MKRIQTKTVEEKYDLYVIPEPNSGCHLWTACATPLGYGQTYLNRKRMLAHRMFYEHKHGPIPAGFDLDHLCRNPYCVNPDHLEAVTHRENTHRENMRRGKTARKTHCKWGHPLEGRHLTFSKDGNRRCLTCSNRRARASEAKAAARFVCQ